MRERMVDGREITLVAATGYTVSTPRYFMGHNLFIKHCIKKDRHRQSVLERAS